jgi:hypothetical protein
MTIPGNQPAIDPEDTLTLTEAFTMVVLTRAQASQLLGRLGDMVRDASPGGSDAFNQAANEVLGR